ncbi:MAG: hypothetical protein M3Q36_01680 [bacterium]|nr:hypothetical protein [bacterium]
MEIEKDIIRFSQQDIDILAVYGYTNTLGEREMEFIDGLSHKIDTLISDEADEEAYILPSVEVPFSKKIADLYTDALSAFIKFKNAGKIDESQYNDRRAKLATKLARRQGFLDGTIVNLSQRRSQR